MSPIFQHSDLHMRGSSCALACVVRSGRPHAHVTSLHVPDIAAIPASDVACLPLPQVRFVENVTADILPPPPPRFPGLNLTNGLNTSAVAPLLQGPLGRPLSGPGLQGTAGPINSYDPLPNMLVNSVQDLMFPGSLPNNTGPIPTPISNSVSQCFAWLSCLRRCRRCASGGLWCLVSADM